MYVYNKVKNGEFTLYVVGYFNPRGKWVAESDHDSAESAAKRVHYLNGGKYWRGIGK